MVSNPFGLEIDQLTTDIFYLSNQIASAGGVSADTLLRERSAKVQAVAKLDEMSEHWRLGRLSEAVEALKAMAASELARQARIVERLNRMLHGEDIVSSTPVVTLPGVTADADIRGLPDVAVEDDISTVTNSKPPAIYRRISIDTSAFDAVSRVAQSEVGHFGKYGVKQFEGGLSAVVETILNRVAHRGFPDTIESVVNQRFQFSAINNLGDWTRLPPARTDVQNVVKDYLEARASGSNGLLRGATHFLNPYLSTAKSLAQWGNHVVANAVAVFGDDEKKDVHYHGFAPGVALPEPYIVNLGSRSFTFSGQGGVQEGADEHDLRGKLLTTLAAELAIFDDGKYKEDHDQVWRRVGTYWSAIGLPYHGRSKVLLPNGKVSNPAWSATFVSWVIKQQGIGSDRFRGAQAHWSYVNDALSGVLSNPLFEVMDPGLYAPRPGDLVHYGREWATQFDLVAARDFIQIDGFYPSHSDFVTAVDLARQEIVTVGGNVGGSVATKRQKVDASGFLTLREKSGVKYPWIAVLRLKP